MKRFINKRAYAPFTALLSLALGSVALGDLTNVVFRVTATVGETSGSFEVTQSQGSWNGDVFQWQLAGQQTILDGSGQPLLQLNGASAIYVSDPIINLTFDFANPLNLPVVVTVDSGQLSFADQAPAQGTASAGITVTDFSGDGDGGAFALGAGGVSGMSAFQANINGLIPAGTQFAELVAGATTAVEGGSESASGSTGGLQNIAGSVTSMSSRFQILLSPLDSVSGTSNFRVIPEPATMALLVIGGLVALRRR